eukprot:gene6056-11077_t
MVWQCRECGWKNPQVIVRCDFCKVVRDPPPAGDGAAADLPDVCAVRYRST